MELHGLNSSEMGRKLLMRGESGAEPSHRKSEVGSRKLQKWKGRERRGEEQIEN